MFFSCFRIILDRQNFFPTATPENLHRRAALLRSLRRFFDSRGFVEVQTPVLSADTVVDRFVEPIELNDAGLPSTHRDDRRYFLQTSPEFAMKRLVATGMERIYQIGPVFRKGDRGQFHNVEFTMLEWYCVGANYADARLFLAELVQHCAVNFGYEYRIVTESFAAAFQKHTGLDPHRASIAEFRNAAIASGIRYPDSYATSEDRDLWIDLLFGELVQPNLRAGILYDYPASQSQLAKTRRDGFHEVSERFELFLNGIELANGYHELLDAAELECRFDKTLQKRIEAGQTALPVASRLISALQAGLPPCCGAALGVDRLLMVLLEAQSIDEVIAFPLERA